MIQYSSCHIPAVINETGKHLKGFFVGFWWFKPGKCLHQTFGNKGKKKMSIVLLVMIRILLVFELDLKNTEKCLYTVRTFCLDLNGSLLPVQVAKNCVLSS